MTARSPTPLQCRLTLTRNHHCQDSGELEREGCGRHEVIAESPRIKVTAVELRHSGPAPSSKVVRVATKTQPHWIVFAR